jgi:hypothetical protein
MIATVIFGLFTLPFIRLYQWRLRLKDHTIEDYYIKLHPALTSFIGNWRRNPKTTNNSYSYQFFQDLAGEYESVINRAIIETQIMVLVNVVYLLINIDPDKNGNGFGDVIFFVSIVTKLLCFSSFQILYKPPYIGMTRNNLDNYTIFGRLLSFHCEYLRFFSRSIIVMYTIKGLFCNDCNCNFYICYLGIFCVSVELIAIAIPWTLTLMLRIIPNKMIDKGIIINELSCNGRVMCGVYYIIVCPLMTPVVFILCSFYVICWHGTQLLSDINYRMQNCIPKWDNTAVILPRDLLTDKKYKPMCDLINAVRYYLVCNKRLNEIQQIGLINYQFVNYVLNKKRSQYITHNQERLTSLQQLFTNLKASEQKSLFMDKSFTTIDDNILPMGLFLCSSYIHIFATKLSFLCHCLTEALQTNGRSIARFIDVYDWYKFNAYLIETNGINVKIECMVLWLSLIAGVNALVFPVYGLIGFVVSSTAVDAAVGYKWNTIDKIIVMCLILTCINYVLLVIWCNKYTIPMYSKSSSLAFSLICNVFVHPNQDDCQCIFDAIVQHDNDLVSRVLIQKR